MKLIEKYKDSIDTYFQGYIPGGFCWLNEDYKEILLENVNILNFTSLYPNIIVGLYDNGYIKEEESNNIERIRYFLKNKHEIKKENIVYIQERTFINSYFLYLNKKYGSLYTGLITQYMDIFYNDFVKENSNNLVYIDVDMIVYLNDIKMDIGLEFFLEKCEFFQINSKKRYVSCIEGVLELKGYRNSKNNRIAKENVKLDEIKNKIISKRRENKLNKILN
jgi:hypothetical protein